MPFGGEILRKLKNYKPTKFKAKDSYYDKEYADFAVAFIESLCHTKGTWAGKWFELMDWQEQIIRDLFGILKPNGYRQFNTAYIEIPKKNGKSELAAAVALLLTCGDGEQRAEVYGAAADRQQASIVFDVAADMVRMCPALNKRVKYSPHKNGSFTNPQTAFIRCYLPRHTVSTALMFTELCLMSCTVSRTENFMMSLQRVAVMQECSRSFF